MQKAAQTSKRLLLAILKSGLGLTADTQKPGSNALSNTPR